MFDNIWTQGIVSNLLHHDRSVFQHNLHHIKPILHSFGSFRCREKDPPVYRLAGLVEHSGTMRGGHYVAYVRGGERVKETDSSSTVWYNVSDAHVRQVSLEKVLHSEAYILFYERIFSQD